MLVRVERKWLDKPFFCESVNLIRIEGNATLKEIKDICKRQILNGTEWLQVKDINPTRFDYIDSDGFTVMCDIYLNVALESHLKIMNNIKNATYFECKNEICNYYLMGYKRALMNEGYDVNRLEEMLYAYAELENPR